MANKKKYASLTTLQDFLSKLSSLFATKVEMNKKAEVQIVTQDDTDTTTKDVTVLKIHELSKEQYDEILANGTADENTIYLTPDDDVSSTHDHNDIYYTKTEIDNLELITVDDINEICGQTIYSSSEVEF